MLVQTHFPRQLSRVRYDQYLASGWFRGAVMLYKMDLLCLDNDLYSVRDGDLKLVTKKNNTVKELYNLNEDLGEENNLAAEFPEEVERLDSLRQSWDAELIDPIFLGLMHTERWKKRPNNNP